MEYLDVDKLREEFNRASASVRIAARSDIDTSRLRDTPAVVP